LFISFLFLYATATTEIYTLSLHDALPILRALGTGYGECFQLAFLHEGHGRKHGVEHDVDLATHEVGHGRRTALVRHVRHLDARQDRKSTRLNSSHVKISYAVFCLKKKTSK